MTTNPDVLRLARSIAASSTTFKLFKDAYLRGDNDNSLIVLVAIAAIERTTELSVQFIDAAPMPGYVERADDPGMAAASHLSGSLEAYDHLRQPEKGSTDE